MILLTEEPLDLAALVRAVGDPEHGGTACFLGSTRREEPDHAVDALVYEAHEELALGEMTRIAAEAAARFGARVAVAHRLGRVAVGEPSVAVAASAGHRPQAFGACRFVIDELKARAPIWKQSVHADGATRWKDGMRPAGAPEPGGSRAR